MVEPALVAQIARASMERIDVPFTVKCRLGVDHHDDYAFFRDFIDQVADAGVTTFIVHARIAILDGLSPAENRTVPPLMYEHVYRLRAERPDLELILNGGIGLLFYPSSKRRAEPMWSSFHFLAFHHPAHSRI